MDEAFKSLLLDDNSYCNAQTIFFRNTKTNVDIQITVITAEINQKTRDYFKIINGVEPPKYMTRVALADKGDVNVGVIEMTDALRERYGVITSVTSIAHNDETLEEAKESFEAAKLAVTSGLGVMLILELAMGHAWPYEVIQ
jgi:hypothetical protein